MKPRVISPATKYICRYLRVSRARIEAQAGERGDKAEREQRERSENRRVRAASRDERAAEGICERGGYYFFHDHLLSALGLSDIYALDAAFGLACAGVAAVACLVTVTLVSGTFRVSLAERVRQFGLFSSAGASCRQLVRAVLVEAALLCAVEIPAGLALGVALDAVALPLVADGTAWVTGGVPVALNVRPEALLGAAAVSAATALLSALAPALRASRLPAVEAMRGDGSTGARGGRPGTGAPLPRRTAGGRDVTALLASRFHRAGRGRDRATVAALAVSVALLVGGGVLGAYFGRASVLEENPALATWDGVVDERAEAHRSEALYGAILALLSTFGVAAAAVGVASAFNSSAASVLLRAHDFAVLRSVGMGERDLRRMPALECTRTAAWGLALGLAAALALGAWIGTQGGLTMRSLGLEVPWAHVVGAVALVALALLASCAHALRRLRAAPLIDALRTE